jgi:hypothetical protein
MKTLILAIAAVALLALGAPDEACAVSNIRWASGP